MNNIIVKKADIHSKAAKELLEELSEELSFITGSSGRNSFDFSDMEKPRSVFVIARENNRKVGCGAIREISPGTAELKRMYARKKACGIGKSILFYLEAQARELGFSRVLLETRSCNTRAVEFYIKNGYQSIENYGKYQGMSEAVCFEKQLNVKIYNSVNI